jgi:hypothetical protein
MDRNIGEKQERDFRVDVRLARTAERSDRGHHRQIEDRQLRRGKRNHEPG